MKKTAVILIVLGLVLEAVAFVALVSGRSPMLIAAALCHMGSAASLTAALVALQQRWSWSGGVLALALPGVGYLGGLLLLLAGIREPDAAGQIYDDYRQHILQVITQPVIVKQVTHQGEFLRAELDFLPLADQLENPDVMMRIGALRACRELRDRWSIKMLLQGTTDPHPEVRLQAMSELASLNEIYQEEIRSAGYEIALRPNDPEVHNTLANLALEYYESGLINDRKYLDMAEQEYRASAGLLAGQVDVCNSLGRIAILKNQPQKGIADYLEALKIEPLNLRARIGLLEGYWATGQYLKILDASPWILKDRPDRFNDLLDFWINGSTEDRKVMTNKQ